MAERITFRTNIPERFEFKYGSCFLNQHAQYGDSYAYAVIQDGIEKRIYAKPTLHEKMVETGAGRGAVLAVTKIEEGNRELWDVQLEREPVWPGIEIKNPDGSTTKAKPAVRATSAAPRQAPTQAPPAKANLHDLSRTLFWCVQEAKSTGLTDETAIQALASTLFIQAARQNTWVPDSGDRNYIKDFEVKVNNCVEVPEVDALGRAMNDMYRNGDISEQTYLKCRDYAKVKREILQAGVA